jgi:ParB-like nuclease domain
MTTPPAPPPPRDRLPFNPLAAIFPLLDRASPEFRGLVASIKQVGLTEPITMHEGMVIDGRNRLLACEEAGVEPRFEQFDDAKMGAVEFVLSKNLHSRHLSDGQRAFAAAEMVTTKHGDVNRLAPKTSNAVLGAEPVTIDKAATLWCVSSSAVDRAAFIRARTQTTPKIVAQVKAGKMELGRAWMLAKKTPEEQSHAPDVKFAGADHKPRPAPRPVTVNSIRALPDEQFLALVLRDLPRLNRAAAREGKRIIVEDLVRPGSRFGTGSERGG